MAITGTLFGLAKTKSEIDSVEIFKSMMLEVNASGAVVMDGRNIAAGSIYANQLSANSITANKIKAGEITTDHITASGISADKIKAGTLTATNGASWINMNNGQFSFGNGKIVYNGSTLAINVESLSITNNPVATKNDVNTVVGEKITAEEKRAIDDANAKLATAKKYAEDQILADKTIKDTRNDNQLPSWYFTNYSRQIVREFKTGTTIGVVGESGYGILTTDVPWDDSSGGSVKQEFRIVNKTYKRSGSSTSWTAWQDYDGLAESAQTDATNAKNSASTANQLLADLSNDNILTPVEKKSIKKEWDIIVSEKTKIDNEATEYGIGAEKTTYNNQYASINTYVTPILANLNTNSSIVGATFRGYFVNYYNARQEVLNAITSKAKALADSAQGTADTIKGVVSNFDSAIINANPIFLDWSSTFPVGYSSMTGSGLTKVVSGNGMGNALRFTVTAAVSSYLNPDVITTFPFFEYVTLETTFKLDSGTIDGAGVLFRYRGTGITDEYVKIKDIIPSPVLNKWYTITKVLKRTEPAGFTGYQVYPMGGFTSFGTVTAKVIQFDSLKTRKSTEQEINAYESNIMIDDMSVDSKITPVEKVQLKKEWATIASERSSLDGKAATFGITTEKTNMTNAYNTLNSVLNGTSGILANMKTTSTVTATTFRAQFDDYYEKKAILQRKIDETSRALANTATDLAQAMTTGKIMYKDPTFKSGTNGITQYNNSGGTTVTATRVTKPADAPTTSAYAMKISTAGTASPGLGGYVQGITARANAKFVVRIIAKIPTGYSLSLATNAMGTGYVDKLITSDAGTGKYEEYIRVIQCGSTGTFSSGGHFYLSGSPNGTAAAPVDWYVAYATAFDITDMDYTIYDIENLANATKDKTDAWTYTGTVEINGGKIRADTVTATQIASNTITANQIATNAIIADKILANAITTAKIATNAVTANEIASNTITANQIATNAIIADKILANAITTAKIATNAVTANEILAGTITANEIKTRTLTADKIVAGSLTSNEIAANSITIGNINPQAFSQGQITTNPIFSDWASTYPAGYAAWASSVGVHTKETTLIKNGGFGVRFAVTSAANYSGIALVSGGTINNQVKPEYLVVEIDFMLVSGTLSGSGMLIDWTGMSGTNRVAFALASEIPSPTLNKWYSVRKVIKAPAATGTFSTITGFLMANYYPYLGAGAVKNIIFDRVALREPSTEEINTFEGNVSNAVTTINNEGVIVKDGSFYLEDDVSSVKYSIVDSPNFISDHSFESVDLNKGDYIMPGNDILHYPMHTGTHSFITSLKSIEGSQWFVTANVVFTRSVYADVGIRASIFGKISPRINNLDTISSFYYEFTKKQTLTLSVFSKRASTQAAGALKMTVLIVNLSGSGAATTLATKTAATVKADNSVQRDSLTFTLPDDYDALMQGLWVRLEGANANYIYVDGVQLVDGTYPTTYNPEQGLMNLTTGGYTAKQLNVNRIQFVTNDAFSGNVGGGALDLNNGDIYNVNALRFNDPGNTEGVHWDGGNLWRIVEAPNSMTNGAGNLQIAKGNERMFTFDTGGGFSFRQPGAVNFTQYGNMVAATGAGNWSLTDQWGHAQIQVYFKDAPAEPLVLNNDGTNYILSKAIYNRTYSGSANMTVTGNGVLGRVTSASKYKLNIKEVEVKGYAEKILDLKVKSWFDKAATEAHARYLELKDKNPEEAENMQYTPLGLNYGLIAEDLESAGLENFASYWYNEDGSKELEGIQYDRLWTLLIPIVKRHEKTLKEVSTTLWVGNSNLEASSSISPKVEIQEMLNGWGLIWESAEVDEDGDIISHTEYITKQAVKEAGFSKLSFQIFNGGTFETVALRVSNETIKGSVLNKENKMILKKVFSW